MNFLALYLHIPFCRRKCDYCVFLSHVPESADVVDAYVKTLCSELQLHRMLMGRRTLKTVYFGGGTPSILSAEQISQVIAAAADAFVVAPGAEITVEANPTSRADIASWLRAVRRAGVNRISIGAQTFHPRGLETIGRDQQPKSAADYFTAARDAGFDNLSLDLIYGVPGGSRDEWMHDIESALALSPEHISIYCLEIHPETPLGRRIKTGGGDLPEADEELAAAMYFAAVQRLEAAGLRQYEISNFARPGGESAHNLAYWRSEDYLGLGLGAASHVGGDRWSNAREFQTYLSAIAANSLPLAWRERLATARRLREQAVVRLRLREGFDVRDFEAEFGARLTAELRADCDALGPRLEKTGNDTYRLPREHLFVSNEIFSRLIG